ncbi:MAG: hypothetical protein ACE5J6_01230 [Candidatus Bathyarchaeia archaeon]
MAITVKEYGKMKMIENLFLIIFLIVLLASIISGLILDMKLVSFVLLLIDFPIAAVTAIFASFSIREEEEAKSS